MMEASDTTFPPTRDAAHQPRPIPPRFWWTKRITIGIAVLLIAVIGIRLWWGWHAERELQRAIAECRADGQPVLLEDFLEEPIPDEENGAHFLSLASAKLDAPHRALIEHLSSIAGDAAAREQYRQTLDRIVSDSVEVRDLIRQTRALERAQWPIVRATALINTPLPHLNEQRRLAKLLRLTAAHQHDIANDSAALESIRDMSAIGRHLGDRPFSLIVYLVGRAIRNMVAHTIESIAPTLDIEGVPHPGQASVATRAQVRALQEELLDERSIGASWFHGICGERLSHIDLRRHIWQGKTLPNMFTKSSSARVFSVLFGPAVKLDAVRLIRREAVIARACSSPHYTPAEVQLPPLAAPDSMPEVIARFASILGDLNSGHVTGHYCSLAESRMAATALAIRLYELDHGRRPELLGALVPDYLSEIPLDPFDSHGVEIHYLPDANPPLLYSVSADGVDSGGAFTLTKRDGVDTQSPDLPFFLNGDRPTGDRERTLAELRDALADDSELLKTMVDDQRPEDQDGAAEE